MGQSMKIRKDDTVLVTGGKDRGKTGRILRTEPRKRRVYVEGLNMVKRHQRPRSIKDTQKSAQAGGIIEKEAPLHISNVAIADPSTGKPTRVGFRVEEDGTKVRVARARLSGKSSWPPSTACRRRLPDDEIRYSKVDSSRRGAACCGSTSRSASRAAFSRE